jgi:cell division protease FtsH
LGGRAAEIVYYGEEGGISSGASTDLERATEIAKAMICKYGMDKEMGLATLSGNEITMGPLVEKINSRVSGTLNSQMREAVEAISAARVKIDSLVLKLLEKNRLTGDEIEIILGINHVN